MEPLGERYREDRSVSPLEILNKVRNINGRSVVEEPRDGVEKGVLGPFKERQKICLEKLVTN